MYSENHRSDFLNAFESFDHYLTVVDAKSAKIQKFGSSLLANFLFNKK